MNKIVVFLLFFLGFLQAQTRVDAIRNKLFNPNLNEVLVVAHRGDWRNFPENSLEAIDSAIEMGVDIVEVDVQRTLDDQLILMHDYSIDRTTTGKGLVSEITLDSIQHTRLKNGCNIRTKHKVPTLEEALLHAKGKIMLNLDKADRFFDQVYELLVKTGTTQQIIMKGSRSAQEVKEEFGDKLKSVIYMPIVRLDKPDATAKIEDFLIHFQPLAFELLFTNDSNPLPQEVKKQLYGKSLIWYNTLWDTMAGGHDDDQALENPNNAYGYLIDELNARIIQTDRPAYLLKYLRERNLHP